MRNTYKFALIGSIMATLLFFTACEKNDPPPSAPAGDLEGIPYMPEAYTIKKPDHFPQMPIPADNPMTVDAVQLGRRLFYDPLLSGDGTMSCSSCHLAAGSFTDNKAVSVGIDGVAGRRSSMSLLNIGYIRPEFGLFWDGRAKTLEEQALLPVEDPIEMHSTWVNVMEKLKTHATYPTLFRKAFGIKSKSEMTKELAAKAIAQFERIIVSSGKSKYDEFLKTRDYFIFDDEELDGYTMFFEAQDETGIQTLPDAQCFHCHGALNMTSGNNYFNNGLDYVQNLDDFLDKGLFEVTGKPDDRGKFRSPGLRNIAKTAPYMHDGRFQTLEQVVEHYSLKGKGVSNEDPLLNQVGLNAINNTLTAYHKSAIIKFLHTLTDNDVINNPDLLSPF